MMRGVACARTGEHSAGRRRDDSGGDDRPHPEDQRLPIRRRSTCIAEIQFKCHQYNIICASETCITAEKNKISDSSTKVAGVKTFRTAYIFFSFSECGPFAQDSAPFASAPVLPI